MPGGIHPPPDVVASWVLRANYDDPFQKRGMVPVVVIFLFISILMVAARTYVRGFMQRNMGLDDWILLVGMIPTIGLSIAMCLAPQAPYYFGRHVWDVPVDNFVAERKLTYAIEMLYIFSTTMIKVSILLFFRRLSSATFSRAYIYTIWAAIAFVVLYCVAYIFVGIFACSPTHAFWDQLSLEWQFRPQNHPYSCINEGADYLSATVISVVQDILVAVLPTWLFWNLAIPKRQKIALAVVFLIGFIICAVGIARIYYIWQIFYGSYDVTYYAWSAWLCIELEVLLGTMCASAPPLKMFFKKVLEIRNGSTIRSQPRTPGRLESLTDDLASKRRSWMQMKSSASKDGFIDMDNQQPTLSRIVEERRETSPWQRDQKTGWYHSDEELGTPVSDFSPRY